MTEASKACVASPVDGHHSGFGEERNAEDSEGGSSRFCKDRGA